MRGASPTPERATYVAPQLDLSWLRNERRKLHKRGWENPAYVFCKLWGLITDRRNLRMAVARVSRNRGHRTAGVDGVTVRSVIRAGVDPFVEAIRVELRSGVYRPAPVRRVFIPKPGQPWKHRPLGIPTVKDRVVQAAVKQILEPIFEADFYPSSYGFRPGRSVHGALEHLRLLLRPSVVRSKGNTRRLPYQWAIEGDIKGCFDNIDHHGLMGRIRRRVGDAKVNRLLVAFLKAGVLSEQQFSRTESGTPQGGILSPLLANIALSVIEERYERHAWPRQVPTLLTSPGAIVSRASAARRSDRSSRPTFFPIRYADDFIILVSAAAGPQEFERAEIVAHAEKQALATHLKETVGLELSETKTLVTPVTKPMRFLGHHVRLHMHPKFGRLMARSLIPKDRSQRLREKVKALFRRSSTGRTLEKQLLLLNPYLRGLGNFYRHAGAALRVFWALDLYIWRTILRWLRKKHHRVPMKELRRRYTWRRPGSRAIPWRDGRATLFSMSQLTVEHFKLGWMRSPDFVDIDGEPGA